MDTRSMAAALYRPSRVDDFVHGGDRYRRPHDLYRQ